MSFKIVDQIFQQVDDLIFLIIYAFFFIWRNFTFFPGHVKIPSLDNIMGKASPNVLELVVLLPITLLV